jgi:hypothetical protein
MCWHSCEMGLEEERRRRRSKSELTIPKRASADSLKGRLRANNWRGGGGGEARNTGVRERNLSITITHDQSSKTRNGSFVITVGRRGSKRLRGGNDTQMRNGNLIITDLVRSTRHARYLGTTTGNTGPTRRLGGHNRGTQEDGSDRRRWTSQTVSGSSDVCSARGGASMCRRLGRGRGREHVGDM